MNPDVIDMYRNAPFLMRHMQALRLLIAPFKDLAAAVPYDASILDVGCGGGLFLCILARQGRIASGTGFDASARAIAAANNMKSRHPAGDLLTFYHRNTDTEWPNGHFDLVSLIDVLHHVPCRDRPKVIKMAAERIKPGGILLYKDMATNRFRDKAANAIHDLVMARQWITHVPFSDMLTWAGNAKLRLDSGPSIKRIYWYAHETAIFRKAKS